MIRVWALFISFVLLAGSGLNAQEADPYAIPDTDLSYEIEVSVDPENGLYRGTETLVWTNRSSEAVNAVPLHLYLNAFSNGSSTWNQEQGGALRFNAAADGQAWGYTDLVSITQVLPPIAGTADAAEVDETAAAGQEPLPVAGKVTWKAISPDDDNPFDRSLMEVSLARPVAPGETLTLEIVFDGRLPAPAVARTGCIPDEVFCFFGQWYPQLGKSLDEPSSRTQAVFDLGQFHGATEFFNDFADFTVTIDTIAGVEIGATGKRVAFSAEADRQRATYRQRAVTNFAFVVADVEAYETTHQPAGSGPEVFIRLLAPRDMDFDAERAFAAIKGSFDVMGRRVGPYPYDVLTVVYPPFSGSAIGGMEYPTLFTGIGWDPVLSFGPIADLKFFELVDIHEFGHMYFQGLVATNERDEAFMDEGFNTYWEYEILEDLYGKGSALGAILGRPVDNDRINEFSQKDANGAFREALAKQPSWLFEPGTGGSQIYARPGATLRTAKNLFGRDVMDAVFREYYRRHIFGHPDTEDFLTVVREVGGDDVEAFLREGFFTPRAPDYAVAQASTAKVRVPAGRYVTEAGVIEISGDENGEALPQWLARAGALDAGPVATITNPGWADLDEQRRGTVERIELELVAAGTASEADPVYQSSIRIDGAAWQNLPVEVVFTFEDGMVAREIWDGREAWRGYAIFTRAPLVKVEVDPQSLIMIDADPANDFRVLKPDPVVEAGARSWGRAFGTFVTILINGAASWL